MGLTGDQREEFRKALMDAFRSKNDLQMMLRFELDWRLNQIAGGDNYPHIVLNFIDYAEANNQVNEILEAAKRANPRNSRLHEFQYCKG
jgi:hypothetical protein